VLFLQNQTISAVNALYRAAQYYAIYRHHNISIWYHLEIQYRDIINIVFLHIQVHLFRYQWHVDTTVMLQDFILLKYDFCNAI